MVWDFDKLLFLVCRLSSTKNILNESHLFQSDSSLYSLMLIFYVEGCFNFAQGCELEGQVLMVFNL